MTETWTPPRKRVGGLRSPHSWAGTRYGAVRGTARYAPGPRDAAGALVAPAGHAMDVRSMTSRRAALALICGVVAVGCGNLIGIPDRELAGSDGGGDATGGAPDASDPGTNALSMLSTSLGTLSPTFSPETFDYSVRVRSEEH